jgi:murein DD-endopeptidase MepM/ murein hydrolase activator NlpD
MFYKVLALEVLLIAGMISLKVRQTKDATSATPVDITESSRTGEDRSTDLLPTEKPKPVVSVKRGELTFPVADHSAKNIISVFGDKRGTRSHQGIDIKAPRGTNVVAVISGQVERIKEGGSGGKQLYLRGDKGRLYYYAHLDSWKVEAADKVKAGQVLGTVGDTGNAKNTTPHLHFEVMIGKQKEAIDPMQFWEK